MIIRQANPEDAAAVSAVLIEAATWLVERGMPLWRLADLTADALGPEVASGMYFVAWDDLNAAGVVRIQLEDRLYWPDAAEGEAVYIHRLAVRRAHAGKGVSTSLMRWAVGQARMLGRAVIRLDCAAERPALRGVYERFGFTLHSERKIGIYPVARYQYLVPITRDGTTG